MSIFVDKPQKFSAKLIEWYYNNQRNLPWRTTNEPYKIWLSEIILQQTRVDQGLDYYNKFLNHYPKLKDLAEADEETILKDWQGLGYYSRARNLHHTARFIHYELGGQFPKSFHEIMVLKGIGEYTAAAIASFAYGLPHAVIDGNVYRVLSRIFGIEAPIDSSKGKEIFRDLANKLLDPKNAAIYNQGIMEFGAIQCLPKKPKCADCIFSDECIALYQKKVDLLPFKQKKLKQRNRFFHYLVLENHESIIINKRNQKEIWQNLYDFPLIETEKKIQSDQFIKAPILKEFLKNRRYSIVAFSERKKHILSHQIIYANFYHIKMEKLSSFKPESYTVALKKELKNYPIPKLIENYLREETNLLSLS